MTLTLNDLFVSPDHFLFAFEGERIVFLPMNRAAYERSIFCDGRIEAVSRQAVYAETRPLLRAALDRPVTSPGWIFHVAHCGSTLLARALEKEAADLVIREPLGLRQLAVETVRRGAAATAPTLRLATTMLGKRYAPDAPVIVKANVPVNFAAEALMALAPETPAICLYYPLERYLAAVLRTENHRKWVESVTTELELAIAALTGSSLAGCDTTQRAAALWRAQIEIYARLAARFPRVRTLDAADLFGRPAEVLTAAFALFGVAASAADISTVVAGPLFSAYSKNPALAFDDARRRTRETETLERLGPELERAIAWLADRGLDAALPSAIPEHALLSA
ncbi:MAG: hypothetical protein ACOH1E_04930 [Brevundimonas sp.]